MPDLLLEGKHDEPPPIPPSVRGLDLPPDPLPAASAKQGGRSCNTRRGPLPRCLVHATSHRPRRAGSCRGPTRPGRSAARRRRRSLRVRDCRTRNDPSSWRTQFKRARTRRSTSTRVTCSTRRARWVLPEATPCHSADSIDSTGDLRAPQRSGIARPAAVRPREQPHLRSCDHPCSRPCSRLDPTRAVRSRPEQARTVPGDATRRL